MAAMKRASTLLVLAALLTPGCGGSGKPSAKTTNSVPSTPTSTATTGASSTDCNTLGINPTGMREGTCTHGGVTWVIVDENHTLKLSTLWAQLAGVRASKTLPNGAAGSLPHGEFVIPSVTITNKVPSAQTFDQANTQQAGLILQGAVFKEDVAAERADQTSCLNQNAQPMQPGKSVTCELVFDVPASAVADLGKHGSGDLYMVNFGSDLSGSIFPQTIGQIRLYR